MNRMQAGLLAVGALVVAIAIVVVGTVSDRSRLPESSVPANGSEPPTAAIEQGDGAQGDAGVASRARAKPEAQQAGGADTGRDAASRGNEATPDRTHEGKAAQAASPDSSAEQPRTNAAQADMSAPARTAKADETSPAAAPSTPAKDGGDEDAGTLDLPTFDVLRVEPDGSTLIAGHAEPNARVDVMNGDTRLATSDTDATGDFVALLDRPLKPGDYELALKAVGKDSKSRTSREVATVSVPRDRGGDLLAMVSKPGQASRLITVPEPDALSPPNFRSDAGADDAAGKRPGHPAANGTSSRVSTDTAGDGSPDQPEGSPTGQTATTPQPEGAMPATEGDSGQGRTLSEGEAQRDVASRTPTAPLGKSARSQINLPALSGPASPGANTEELRIEAVEIEGDSVYVAGAAPPDSKVRVYADDRAVGQSRATEEGRFVVNGTLDLAPGRHVVRADLIDPASGKVVMRATVPFERPEQPGRFAAVSPGAEDAAPSPDVARLKADAESALADLEAKVKAATPSADAIRTSRKRAAASLEALSEAADDVQAGDPAQTGADRKIRKKAASALKTFQRLPQLTGDAELTPEQLKSLRAEVRSATETMGEEPAGGEEATRRVSSAAGGPKTLAQPALTRSDSFVIIRRGDNLWQISRRVYGRGIRYTTIYLANDSQIHDPNLILPGQVFDVPGKPSSTIGQAEELHRQLLHDESRR